jgi:hypothetical protein
MFARHDLLYFKKLCVKTGCYVLTLFAMVISYKHKQPDQSIQLDRWALEELRSYKSKATGPTDVTKEVLVHYIGG